MFPFQRRGDDDDDDDIKRDGDDECGEGMKIDGEYSDDDVSLVSRSPSPAPQDQMDIDKYDDYVRGPVREVITVDTKIKSTNIGFRMLSKLGWVEGQPLGLSQDGVLSPSITWPKLYKSAQLGLIPSLSTSRMTQPGSGKLAKIFV